MGVELKPFAFVLMPFDNKFKDIYLFGIKQACEEADVIAERVDEQRFSETILDQIYRQIENADFIVAEMTGRNANVFYEVGYCHAKQKLCIMATQSAEDIPFDLKQHPHIIYDGTAADLKSKLKDWITWAKAEVKLRKSLTITVEGRAVDSSLAKTEYHHVGNFDLLLKFRNNSTKRSPEIEAIYINVTKEWQLSIHGKDCPSELSADGELRRYVLSPAIRRLAPNAFSQERVSFNRVGITLAEWKRRTFINHRE